MEYTVSRAKNQDILGIYNLLHRKFVKKYSPNSQDEEWEKHRKWYEFWIESPYYYIYVLKDFQDKIIGQIRFEIDGEVAIMNIFIDEKNRGKGLGNFFLEESINKFKKNIKKIRLIISYILEENERSKTFFSNFGFLEGSRQNYNGVEHLSYSKSIE